MLETLLQFLTLCLYMKYMERNNTVKIYLVNSSFIAESPTEKYFQTHEGQESQHGFRKRKSCLTNLVAFYNEGDALVDERTAMDVVCLDFSKVFNSVSHVIRGTTSSWR